MSESRRLFAAALLLLLFTGCRDVEPPTGPDSTSVEVETTSMSQTTTVGYKAIDLGAATSGERSVATHVNNAGQVLLIVSNDFGFPDKQHTSFLWQDGVLTSLGVFTDAATCCADPFNLATDLNDAGQVIGAAGTVEGLRAYLWDEGLLTDLGTLPGGDFSAAHAINESGQVVGQSDDAANELRAVLWEGGVPTDLGTLGGAVSKATLINESGQVAGSSWTADGETHAFLWTDGTMVDLVPVSGSHSRPTGINEAGDVVGRVFFSNFSQHAFLWRDGVYIDLGPGRAVAINEGGQVLIASAPTASGVAVWTDGIVVDVGDLGGGSSDVSRYGDLAMDRRLNTAGWVVGDSRTADGLRPFLWDGTLRELETLGGTYGTGVAINDFGHVVGESSQASGPIHATLWRPITVDEAVQDLVDDVASLEDLGTINQGQAHALTNHLTIAAAMIEDGKTTPAANKLQAFINQVEGMISGSDPVLPPEEGQPLIDAANALLSTLTG